MNAAIVSYGAFILPDTNKDKNGLLVINSNLTQCMCRVNTSIHFYTTHFLLVSVSSSVNTPLELLYFSLLVSSDFIQLVSIVAICYASRSKSLYAALDLDFGNGLYFQ